MGQFFEFLDRYSVYVNKDELSEEHFGDMYLHCVECREKVVYLNQGTRIWASLSSAIVIHEIQKHQTP